MEDQKSSFRQIFKATAIFGGVQTIQVVISIVRSKVIAVLLGPAGMGVAGLLTSATSTISMLTNMGLGTSAVKNISEANAQGDMSRIGVVVSVFRRLVWLTGFLGMGVTLLFSPFLSQLTFGSNEYILAFGLLSVTLLIDELTVGQGVLLQAMRKLKYLAKSRIIGSIFGLIIVTPLYYFYGLKGIVPGIILGSVTAYIIAHYYGKRVKVNKVKFDLKVLISEGDAMVRMGIMISLSSLIASCLFYVMRIFISHKSGINDVGLYQAGMAIINNYVGLVFMAMGTDYYPRLSAVARENSLAKKLINQQSEVSVLILAPILALFLIFIDFVIVIIYTKSFLVVNGMIHWAALGIYFKAVSWAIAFLFLAKGASKIFFWSELIANIYTLCFNVIGYMLGVLDGIGISFLIGYIVYFLQVYILARVKYGFSFEAEFRGIFFVQFILGVLCMLVISLLPSPLSYYIGSVPVAIAICYSLLKLNDRLDIVHYFDKVKEMFFR